jgi:hypothetical protein
MKSNFHQYQRTVELSPTVAPIQNNNPTAGYSIPLKLELENQNKDKLRELNQLAGQILREPLLQILLSQRIYDLMSEDLTYYKERARSYGGRI